MSEFIRPEKPKPRKKYKAFVERKNENGWNKTHVVVKKSDKVVFEYDRNYSMLNTFEPFRQLRNGVWRDYALISTKYTRFEVVDLQLGQIIAIEPYPTIDQEWHDRIISGSKDNPIRLAELQELYPVGKEMPGSGFCPVDFYVPDWWDIHWDITPDNKYWNPKEHEHPTGEFALYSGCFWGDDNSWKLRYIDLSKISEGIVTSDSRFGYVELAKGLNIRKSIDYWPLGNRIYTQVQQIFDLSGEAWEQYYNWKK